MVGRGLPPGWAALFILSILNLVLGLSGCLRGRSSGKGRAMTSPPPPPPPPSSSRVTSPVTSAVTSSSPPSSSSSGLTTMSPKCEDDAVVLDYDPNKMVTIIVPRGLLPDRPNRLQLHSVYPLSGLAIRFSAYGFQASATDVYYQISSTVGKYLTEVKFRLPIVTEEGGPIYLTVRYAYCLPDENGDPGECNHTQTMSQKTYASFIRKFVVILGESDKPIYRPGENIRFRFVALNSRQLYPTTEQHQWPKFRIDLRTYVDAKVVRVSEDEIRRREGLLGFDVIYVEDPNGNRAKEWRNVSQTTAFNMSFPLPPDTSEGVWRVVARVFSSIETLQVDVENYALPPFLATIQVPKEVEAIAETAHFNVCAKYTNGHPFQGRYAAKICVAPESELKQQLQYLGTLFENNVGRNSSRPCLPVTGSLFGTPENGGCVSANFSMKSLMQHAERAVEEGHKLGFLVKISEKDTGSAVTRFGQAEIRVPKMDLKIDSTYRPGLPIYGKMRLPEMDFPVRRDSVTVQLTVFEVKKRGDWPDILRTIYSTKLRLNSEGAASFILPPVSSERNLRIEVNLIPDKATASSRRIRPSPVMQRIMNLFWRMESSVLLRRWEARSSLALKVSSINGHSAVPCPGTLNLTIMANAPLAEYTLFLEFLSRGVQTRRTAVLQPARSGYVCSDEDSDLGHYTCNTRFQPGELGEISCRPGWTGDNCLKPYYFSGKPVRRTIFMHEAIFEMDAAFGPTLDAVVYVINSDSSLTGGYELISDHLQIENLKLCSTQAIFDSSLKSPIHNNLNKHSLMPGDRVDLQLSVPTARDSESYDVDYSCILRLVDTSLRNFENFKDTLVDLNKYTNELQENRQSYYNDKPIYNTKTAFEAIGIDFFEFQQPSMRIERRECYVTGSSYGPLKSTQVFEPPVQNSALDTLDAKLFKKYVLNAVVKPRVRDIFPEVWLFDHVKLDKAGQYNTGLTAPDGITSWEFSALCFTPNMGIWMPPRLEPEIVTVSLPFYVDLTLPVKAKRHEVLHLPVSVFMLSQTSANETADKKPCYEVVISVAVDHEVWQLVNGSSEFSKCMCQGDPKATFTVALKPWRLGRLNVTAEARTKSGSALCTDRSAARNHNVSVADAVRRSILVVPEGVEAETTVGRELCISEGRNSMEEVMRLDLPQHIVEGSLRSYVSVSGIVLGKPMKNLDNLVDLPTGCGEQNMVTVAPSVYVLKYLAAAADLREPETKKLAQTAMYYIAHGYARQLNYSNDDGSFSIFPWWKPGSTWLTAFVFGVFSEAQRLLQEKGLDVLWIYEFNFNPTLYGAFGFLKAMQLEDGCFVENGHVFQSDLQAFDSSPKANSTKDLLLTSYVLSALIEAPVTLKANISQAYANIIDSASRCLLNTIDSIHISEIPLRALAKVAYALRQLPEQAGYLEKRDLVYRELLNRASASPSGALRWWRDEKPTNPASDVETTAYAYLALAESRSVSTLRPIIRWLLSQQNARGGFYSTQDTVVALRALAHAAARPQLSTSGKAHALVTASILPGGLKTQAIVVNRTNAHVSQQVELGSPEPATPMEVKWEMSSLARATCVVVHFSAFYNVPNPEPHPDIDTSPFSISVRTTQAPDFSPDCTHAHAAICVRLSERAINSNNSIDTGMILLTFQLPTGWKMTESVLPKSRYPGLSRVEYNEQKQTLSVYFDAFTDKEAKEVGGRYMLVRCISQALNQTVFVENLRPSLIRVQDYYAPEKKTETTFWPNACKPYWQTQFSASDRRN